MTDEYLLKWVGPLAEILSKQLANITEEVRERG
jgi:hypothetical protein